MVSTQGRPGASSATRSDQIATGDRPRRNSVAIWSRSAPRTAKRRRRGRRAAAPTLVRSGHDHPRGRPPGQSSTGDDPPGGRPPPNSPSGQPSARGRSPRVRATPAVRLACWYLHRSALEFAPVIMTGTMHRPMELAPLRRESRTVTRPQCVPRLRDVDCVSGSACHFGRGGL